MDINIDGLWDMIGDYNRDQGDPKTALPRAKVSIERGDMRNAILDLSHYLQQFPDDVEAILLRADCYFNTSNFQLASADYKNAYTRPDTITTIDSIYNYALSLYKSNQQNEALNQLNAIINIDRNYKKAYLMKGEILHLSGEYDKAFYYLTRAIELDNKMWEAYCMRGQCRYFLQDWFQATRDFQNTFAINPNQTPRVNLILGICLYNSGKRKEGIEEVLKAKNLGDTHAEGYLQKMPIE